MNTRKIILGLCLIAAFFMVIWAFSGPSETRNLNVPEKDSSSESEIKADDLPKTREAEIIEYGVWTPANVRAVLGTVESDSEIEVQSEVSGNIATVLVNVGDEVRAGQVLARFKLAGDPTQIQYLNAVSGLNSARNSSANSIKQAEINVEAARKNLAETKRVSQESTIRQAEIQLENARKSLERTIAQQSQNYQQNFVNLGTQAKTSQTTFENTINYLDRQLIATNKYRYEFSTGREEIGNRNTILKNNTKNQTAALSREFDTLKVQTPGARQSQITQFARANLQYGRKLQDLLNDYYVLIDDTVYVQSVNEASLNAVRSEVEGLRGSLDSVVQSLESSLESALTAREGSDLSVTNAQNQVLAAEASLELARSQAESQVTSAQNQIDQALAALDLAKSQANSQVVSAQDQVNITYAARSDLIVTAPISGTISARSVNVGNFVSTGSTLFSIVNSAATKKAVANLTADEWFALKDVDTVTLKINDQAVIASQFFLSEKVDPVTQKIRGEFVIPNEQPVLIGSVVRVQVPIQADIQNLIPLSSVSFEPDGVEVLVVGANNLVERRSVSVGEIVADSIQILDGLEVNDRVIRYQSRVFPGDQIINGDEDSAIETKEEDVQTDAVENQIEETELKETKPSDTTAPTYPDYES